MEETTEQVPLAADDTTNRYPDNYPTFEALCAIEPRLLQLKREAISQRASRVPWALAWYGDANRPGLKRRLLRLVGWGAESELPLLRSSEAYDVVYDTILGILTAAAEHQLPKRQTMSSTSRNKGKKAEREIVNLARQAGLDAGRTWHLAQSPDATERRCDVVIEEKRCQVKKGYGGAFRKLYDGLQDVDFLLLRSDREAWLATVPAEKLFELLFDLRSLRSRLESHSKEFSNSND